METVNSVNWGEMNENETNANRHFYPRQVILIIFVSSIGLFFDLFVLHLYYITKCFYISGQRIRSGFAPVTVSTIWLIYQLIKSLFNYHNSGLPASQSFCQIDTIINVSLFQFFYMTIVIMSEVLSKDFSSRPMKTNDLFKRFMLFGIYSAIIGILSASLPGSAYSMDQTGIYCFLDFDSYVSIFIFIVFGIVLPTAHFARNLTYSNEQVDIAQKLLLAEGLKSEAKIRQRQVIKSATKSIKAYSIIQIVNIITALYKTITYKFPPVFMDIIGTDIHLIYTAIIPIHVYSVTYELSDTFHEVYSPYLHRIWDFITQKSSSIDVVSTAHEMRYEDWNYWIEHADLHEIFFKYAKSTYVSENLLFYDQVKVYQTYGQQLMNSLTDRKANLDTTTTTNIPSPTSRKLQNNSHKVNDNEIQLWCKMYEEACYIYKLFIKVPTAPLEINIPSETRQKLFKTLKFSTFQENLFVSTDIVPMFKDISHLNNIEAIEIVNEYMNAFDEAIDVISNIIHTDIFPRFKKKGIYKDTILNTPSV